MSTQELYRGGTSLRVFPGEVKIDAGTGLLRTTHGISVWDRPDGLGRFGGAYKVTSIPPELKVLQRGRDPHHFEIVPAFPMDIADYQQALDEIVLVAV